MKKIVFSLAVISIAAMMVSCSGNKTNAGEDTDSVIIEVEELSGQTVDAGDLTIVIPDGWKIEDKSSTFLKIKKDMGDKQPKQLWFFPYRNNPYTAKMKAEVQTERGEELRTPVVIAKKKWHVVYKAAEGDNQEFYNYYVDFPDSGYLNVRTFNGYECANDPEIKEILESIKFK